MRDKPSVATLIGRLANGWFQAQILRRRLPLLTAWNLTFHCNLRCQYCACPELNVPEFKTAQVLEAITQFHQLGMRWVTFSGGEPLLRKDLGAIVDHSKDLGMVVFVSTNGTLLPQRIDALRRVDKFTISFDGPEAIHDQIRGAGTFQKTTRAVSLAQDRGIDVGLTCVVSSHNVQVLDEVLEYAERMGVTCMFQPATKWLNSHADPNPIAPDTEIYRAAMRKLIERKRQGGPISNSMAGLEYLMHWPDPTPIRSTAGRLTCTVESDGKVLSSHITQTKVIEQAREDLDPPWVNFKKLVGQEVITQDWCGPILELDLLFALNPSALWNAFFVHSRRTQRRVTDVDVAPLAP